MRLGLTRDQFTALSWVDQRMYIEELQIDTYQEKMKQWEEMDEDQQWETPMPVKPNIVIYYEERGELWLDDMEEVEDVVAPDILG